VDAFVAKVPLVAGHDNGTAAHQSDTGEQGGNIDEEYEASNVADRRGRVESRRFVFRGGVEYWLSMASVIANRFRWPEAGPLLTADSVTRAPSSAEQEMARCATKNPHGVPFSRAGRPHATLLRVRDRRNRTMTTLGRHAVLFPRRCKQWLFPDSEIRHVFRRPRTPLAASSS
jgi:hypothetical protein